MWDFIHQLVSPKKFFYFSRQLTPWLSIAFILLLTYGLVGGLIFAPADLQQGDGFRIIYVHAPSAFLSLFIYGIMASAAFTGIVWRLKISFLIIRHSAPIGAIFTLLALVTGSIWGKPMWGTWWIWDARLTSELILLFLYAGIILFQSAMAEKRSAERVLAVLVLVGFLDIPIIHYSVYWWNTLHQGATLRVFQPSLIDKTMVYPLLSMMGAFLLYYFLVLILRINYELTAVQKNHHWIVGLAK